MVWTLAVPLIVLATAFFVLAIGLLVALKRAVNILGDIEDKLHALNPLCRIVYRLGEHMEECCESRHSRGVELVDLILSGINLVKKWRRK